MTGKGDDETNRINFLVLGAQRSGTTWIDSALRRHPQVFLPARKQTYFFDQNYDNGFDWYLSHFSEASQEHVAVGEVGTKYCEISVFPRIAMHLPSSKFILSVRNPIERAFSAYSYYLTIADGATNAWANFEEALEVDPTFLERGRYIEQIEVIHQHCDPSRLLILFYDDLNSDENHYWRSMLEFLGLDASVPCQQIGQRRNSLKGTGFLKKFDRLGMKPVRKWLQSTSAYTTLRKAAKRLTAENYNRAIAPATRSRLIEYFRPYNERLAELTGRNLDAWNR